MNNERQEKERDTETCYQHFPDIQVAKRTGTDGHILRHHH